MVKGKITITYHSDSDPVTEMTGEIDPLDINQLSYWTKMHYMTTYNVEKGAEERRLAAIRADQKKALVEAVPDILPEPLPDTEPLAIDENPSEKPEEPEEPIFTF